MEERDSMICLSSGAAAAAAVESKESLWCTPSPSPTPSPPTEVSTGGTSGHAPGAGIDDMVAPPPSAGGMGMAMGIGMGVGVGLGMGMGMMGGRDEQRFAMKKRGRPRKYEGEETMALALTSPPMHGSASPFSLTSPDSSGKRGRGRPPGSGKRQLLANLGEWFAYSAGGNFTPHVVTIATGEDVASKILSLSQKGPRSICILSANGAISNVTLRQPGSSGGTLTYEGRFEILSLSGSFTVTEDGGIRSKSGGISVSLAGPDGRVVGGGVAGLLLAASPIQVVVGSFLPNALKEQKRKATPEATMIRAAPDAAGITAAARPISQAAPFADKCENSMPPSLNGQNHGGAMNNSMSSTTPTSTYPGGGGGWHGLQSSEHKPSPDINICLQSE